MKRKLKIKRSPYIGYCFGVKRAMRLIDDGLASHEGPIFTIGDVIHNKQAVERLKARGVQPLPSLDLLDSGSVLVIRAHGATPDIITRAKKRGITLIDTTCPFVERIQNYAKKLSEASYTVIIIGNSNHPEVQSISGNVGDEALIVNSVDTARRITSVTKAGVVIQTTFSREKAEKIIEVIRKRVEDLRVYDTICQATELRREATLELAKDVDMMLVIGGRGSSNTRGLYQMCVEHGIPVKFIETAEEIEPSWFEGCRSVGLTTGTSTPGWIVDEVVERMESIADRS
jgi:(E)-4-hydroxy-3-methyl-but-2-enyl pyrophosphate reductase